MDECPVITIEVRFLWLETGEVLVATRPRVRGATWSVGQAVEVED